MFDFIVIESVQGFLDIGLTDDRVAYAVMATLVSAVSGLALGRWMGSVNPPLWRLFDVLLGGLGDRLDKEDRLAADLVFRGFLVLFFCLAIALVLAKLTQAALPALHYGVIAEILIVSLCITSGAVWRAMRVLYRSLHQEKLVKGAYLVIARSTRYDLNTTDDFGITRAGIAMAAQSYGTGLVAPLLWYLLAGIPGIMLFTAVSFFAWRFGRNGSSKGFGLPALALRAVLLFVPNMLSVLMMLLAIVISPTLKSVGALRSVFQPKLWADSAQGGALLSVVAYALHVALGGPIKDVSGHAVRNAWVGPDGASAKTQPYHLQRVMILHIMGCFIVILALLAGYLYLFKSAAQATI